MADQAKDGNFSALFEGKMLQGKDGEVDPTTLDGQYVALYFSAHWCPPCRGFTPVLASLYPELQLLGMTVVFCSSDKDQGAFDEYYGEMPWLALPYKHREIKEKLATMCGVKGIPMLCLFNKQGEMYNSKGRAAVNDMDGFPWVPPTFEECLQKVTKKGESVDLSGKTLGFYFSAHWCGPCRNFTPELIKWYERNAERLNMEIIFVSSDRDDASYNNYYGEMPWATTGMDVSVKGLLNDKFGVNGIPHFGICDGDGEIIRRNARGNVASDPDGAKFPWPAEAVCDIDDGVDGINELPSLLLLQKGSTEDEKQATAGFIQALAVEQMALKSKREALFFTENKECAIGSRIRQITKVEGTKMIILQVTKGGFYERELPTSADDVTSFFNDFKAGSLTMKKFS